MKNKGKKVSEVVKLGGIARARAMTVLEKVVNEYDGKLEELEKDSEEYKTAVEEKEALQTLLWSMQNIADGRE